MAKKGRGKKVSIGSMETELRRRHYTCRERGHFDSRCDKERDLADKGIQRFAYRKGSFRVLTECPNEPWWTVQKMLGSRVDWFVDFPLDVPVDIVFVFIDEIQESISRKDRAAVEEMISDDV